MNKTQAAQIAKQARRHGYFKTATEIYLWCPQCRVKVTEVYSLYAGTVTKQLDQIMVRHLTDPEACATNA